MMKLDTAGDIMASAIHLVMLISMVTIIPGLLMGLCVSIFQATTQINEQTLSFLPRLMVTLLALIFCGKWIITQLVDFTVAIFSQASALAG